MAFEAINYYTNPLTVDQLKDILEKLDMAPRDLMRTGEAIYKELGIASKEYSDQELIELMVKYPDLIQRPIVITGTKASIVRTQEAIDQLLNNAVK